MFFPLLLPTLAFLAHPSAALCVYLPHQALLLFSFIPDIGSTDLGAGCPPFLVKTSFFDLLVKPFLSHNLQYLQSFSFVVASIYSSCF